ncbi:MAG: FAD-dependent oxidoreductase [Acidimicrobiaceae bacterium]|nr:FAD-dependent oxidoreductase [Acidimicrobiaceae bacterium]HBU76372.1 FAD-dependent oxidoreductase [Acidimicrobiaceae bacterium]
MSTAIVVGGGPNGLAAAARLARAGCNVTVLEASDTIGGGARSSEYLAPGLLHDHCSAVHPMALASPFFQEVNLPGLEWCAPEIDCAHPLDDGSAGAFAKSFDVTDELLGADARRWRQMFAPVARKFDTLFADISQPVLRVPRHPLTLTNFGIRVVPSATLLARTWKTEQARALWGGVAAHAFWRLDRPLTSAVGVTLTAAAHAHGWVVAKGGTQRIVDALVADIVAHQGKIETSSRVSSVDDLPPHDVLMLDVVPSIALEILGDRLPSRIARAYRSFSHGPGAFKVDFAVEGGIPWTAQEARRAGTVHVGGSFDEIAANERAVVDGKMPTAPFVLVGQQYLADPSRSAGNVHPIWAYAHVPHGYTGDATEAIVEQIERFAPGFRERVVGMAVRSTTEMSKYNENYVGGDIIGGAGSPLQTVFRPRVSSNPYATGIPGVYLCSSSTPPGAGAHGMCGANAADRALTRCISR